MRVLPIRVGRTRRISQRLQGLQRLGRLRRLPSLPPRVVKNTTIAVTITTTRTSFGLISTASMAILPSCSSNVRQAEFFQTFRFAETSTLIFTEKQGNTPHDDGFSSIRG